MQVNVAKTDGKQLDWLVGYIRCLDANGGKPIQARDLMQSAIRNGMASPSTDWSEGGPILEKAKITLLNRKATNPDLLEWFAHSHDAVITALEEQDDRDMAIGYEGPTALTAGMRCFVASRMGELVEVPDELA